MAIVITAEGTHGGGMCWCSRCAKELLWFTDGKTGEKRFVSLLGNSGQCHDGHEHVPSYIRHV